MIGASADRRKFGNRAVRAYTAEGYSVVPINPHEAEVEGLFQRCDALVLPYRRGFEAQSGVLLQACRFGKPVVASDVSDLGRQVAEDGVGLVVPPEDGGALAAALARMAERPGAFEAGLAAARGRYAWERVAALHLAGYEKVPGTISACLLSASRQRITSKLHTRAPSRQRIARPGPVRHLLAVVRA